MKENFLPTLFVCLYPIFLLSLISRRRGSYVAAIQRRVLFTTALYHFCTDKLWTQTAASSPHLSLSFYYPSLSQSGHSLFLSLTIFSCCISGFTATSLPEGTVPVQRRRLNVSQSQTATKHFRNCEPQRVASKEGRKEGRKEAPHCSGFPFFPLFQFITSDPFLSLSLFSLLFCPQRLVYMFIPLCILM